jgi:hypothetical protein
MRYELSDKEWSIIRAMLPTKPRGVPRVDDRRSEHHRLVGKLLRCMSQDLALNSRLLQRSESDCFQVLCRRCPSWPRPSLGRQSKVDQLAVAPELFMSLRPSSSLGASGIAEDGGAGERSA